MVIAQRGTSTTVNDAAAFYAMDRWECQGQSADGVYTVDQSSTVPVGFVNSLLATVTTADASIGATQSYAIRQKIEGYNIADLNWGTANAKAVTVSFWVRSSLTGTFGGALINGGFSRSYPFSYTISVADTWEQKSVTIAGDTTGTWSTDNSTGIVVSFSMGAGSSRLGTAGAWVGANNQGATGQTNIIATVGATFYITGVQLEVGSNATGYEYRQYGQELALCQRYYQRQDVTADNTYFSIGQAYATNGAITPIYFSGGVMRTAPTITLGTAGTSAGQLFPSKSDSNPPSTVGTLSAITSTIQHFVINATGWTSAFTAGNGSGFIAKGPCNVYQASAEL